MNHSHSMSSFPGWRPDSHSRQSSVGSMLPPSSEGISYVKQLRMAKATVWSERGPKDAISDARKKSTGSQKKGMFGKLFTGNTNGLPLQQQPMQYAKPSKTKLRNYAAPQHTTLVPRLSASEANETDDFTNFTSSTYLNDKRASHTPSLARSSLYQTQSQSNSIYNVESAPTSPIKEPRRMDSVASSYTSSGTKDLDGAFSASTLRTATFTLPSNTAVSRSGSPTQLQQYTVNHIPSDSDDDIEPVLPRTKLFIANADLSDSD